MGPTVTKSVRLPPEVWARLEEEARAGGIPLHALRLAASKFRYRPSTRNGRAPTRAPAPASRQQH